LGCLGIVDPLREDHALGLEARLIYGVLEPLLEKVGDPLERSGVSFLARADQLRDSKGDGRDPHCPVEPP